MCRRRPRHVRRDIKRFRKGLRCTLGLCEEETGFFADVYRSTAAERLPLLLWGHRCP